MDETLIKKLTAIVESQKQLEDDLSKVDISSDPNKYAEMAKKHSDMSSIVELFRQWETLTSDISDAEELLNEETDEEMKSEYEDIIKNSNAEIENIVTKIKVGLLPKDPSDEKDVLVEIRPGEQVVRKHPFGLEIYSKCIHVLRNVTHGMLKR